MAERDGFILHYDNLAALKRLSDEQVGKLVRWLYAYDTDGESPEGEDVALLAIFDLMAGRLDRDKVAYAETSEKRAQRGRNGAARRWEDGSAKDAQASASIGEDANECLAMPSDAKPCLDMLEMADPDPDPDPDPVHPHDCGCYKALEAAEVIALYAAALPMLPEVRGDPGGYMLGVTAAAGILSKSDVSWAEYFSLVAQSDFLTGKTGKFSANFPWLLKPGNVSAVLSGKYGQAKAPSAGVPRGKYAHVREN